MRAWRGVGLVGGWQLTASICFYAIFAATAFLRTEFHLSRTLVGLTITATMGGYILCLLPAGALVDAYGERRVMVVGLLCLAAGALGVALAPGYLVILVALVALGGAYATAMPGTNRAVLHVAPPGRRNLSMNVKQVGVTAGSGASALLVTGAATSRFGWRAGFLVAGGLALLVAALFARGYDGRTGGGTLSTPDVRGLFSDAAYRRLLGVGFCIGATIFTTTGYTVLYLTESVGLAAGLAGATLALTQVTGSGGRLAGGALADRLPGSNVRANAQLLLVAMVVGAGLFGLVTVVETGTLAVVGFAALGVFVLGTTGIYYGCLTALVADDEVGAATAGAQSVINVGGLLTPPAFGFVADTFDYGASWLLLAGLALLGGLLVVSLIRNAGRERS